MRNWFKRKPKVVKSVSIDSETISYSNGDRKIWTVKIADISKFICQSGPYHDTDTYFFEAKAEWLSCCAEAENAPEIWRFFLSKGDANEIAAAKAIRDTGYNNYLIWERKDG